MLRENADQSEIFDRVLKAIGALLNSRGEEDKSTVNINLETDLIAELGIDSVEVLDLVGFIEKEFSISVDVEKIPARPKINDIVEVIQHIVCGE